MGRVSRICGGATCLDRSDFVRRRHLLLPFPKQSLLAVARYFALNAVLLVVATGLVTALARWTIELNSAQPVSTASLSRVEAFKQAETDALARRPEATRKVVAYTASQIPAPVLAMRLDEAEAAKSRRVLAKRLTPARVAINVESASAQQVRPRPRLPRGVMALGALKALQLPMTAERKFVVAESTRDITNRSLGVLVAREN